MPDWPWPVFKYIECFSLADNKTCCILYLDTRHRLVPFMGPTPTKLDCYKQQALKTENVAELPLRRQRPLYLGLYLFIKLSPVYLKHTFNWSLNLHGAVLRMKTCVSLRWPRSLCPWNAFRPSEITASQWDEGRVRGQLKGEGCLCDEAVLKRNVLKTDEDIRTEFNLRPSWFCFCLTVRAGVCSTISFISSVQFRSLQCSHKCHPAPRRLVSCRPHQPAQMSALTKTGHAHYTAGRHENRQTVYRQTGWANLQKGI